MKPPDCPTHAPSDRALSAMAPGIDDEEYYPFERPYLAVTSADFDITCNAFEHAGLMGEIELGTPGMDDEVPVTWRR